jgi:AcrR family transcriptional regulator
MKRSVIPDPPSADHPMHERILRAAFQAFTQDGYADTSTLEIARRAKISKRDLYANFGSKHAVLIACINSRADRMRLPPDLLSGAALGGTDGGPATGGCRDAQPRRGRAARKQSDGGVFTAASRSYAGRVA